MKIKRYKNYRDYLVSSDWLVIKTKYIGSLLKKKLPINCLICNSFKNLAVHHTSYLNLYTKKEIGDLELLCNDCHKKLHFDITFKEELGELLVDAILRK